MKRTVIFGARWKLREFKVRLFDNISKFGSGGPDLSLLNLVWQVFVFVFFQIGKWLEDPLLSSGLARFANIDHCVTLVIQLMMQVQLSDISCPITLLKWSKCLWFLFTSMSRWESMCGWVSSSWFGSAKINMPAALAWELFEEGLQKAERTAEALFRGKVWHGVTMNSQFSLPCNAALQNWWVATILYLMLNMPPTLVQGASSGDTD